MPPLKASLATFTICATAGLGLASAGCGESGSDGDEFENPTPTTSTLAPNDAQTFTGPGGASNETPTSQSGGTSGN